MEMVIQLKIEVMITQLITKNLIQNTTLAIALKDDIGEQNKLFAKMPEKMGEVWRGRHYRAVPLSHVAQQVSLYQTFAFPSLSELPFSPFEVPNH